MNKKYTPSVNRRTARPRSKRLQTVGGSYTVIKNSGRSGSSKPLKIDTSMSDTSENAVANKVIKRYVDAVRRYFEDKVPDLALIDLANILTVTQINQETRSELYRVVRYTEGGELPSDPVWVIDTRGQHYIVRMLETETGVGFFIIGYEGFTRIEGDNSKTNQLLRDKIDKEYVKDFLSQASFDPAKTHDYIVPSVVRYTTVEDSVGAGGRSVNFGIDLRIKDDIEDAAEDELDNEIFHNGLVTALGVKKWVEGKGYLTSADIEGVDIVVDDKLSDTSTNPVQNKVITAELEDHDTRISDMESFFAEGAKLNLRINSNQNNDSVIAAVKATITYDDETLEVGSGTIGLPPFKIITITFPDVQGYKTPEQLVFETGAVPISHTVTYETEVARVTLSAYDGYSVIGSTIAIDGVSYVWNGATIDHKVPYGKTYEAEAITDIEGYIRPEETYTASQPIREIDIQYSAMVGSWIIINQTITDPAGMITGDIRGEHIQLIRQNSHRYLCKNTSEGTMTLCQLDDNDSNYYKDGSEANLRDCEGEVFMRLPRFFYAAVEKRTDVWSVGFYYGNTAPSSQWKEWDGNDLIGASFAREYNSKLDSCINSYNPAQSYNYFKSSMELCKARGLGFSLVKWKHHCIMAFLFYAYYGHTNIQEICGSPNTIDYGNLASFGMADSVPGDKVTCFWGLSLWYGNQTEFIEGVDIEKRDDSSSIVYITEDNGEIRVLTIPRIEGYSNKIMIGDHLDLFSLDNSASGSTGYCDYIDNKEGAYRSRGGTWTLSSAGVSCFERETENQRCHARLVFRGNLVFENNPETFKSLTAIN